MGSLDDRLSRIAALRPPGRPDAVSRPEKTDHSNFDQLLRLLRGAVRENSLGRHTIVRFLMDEPRVRPLDPAIWDLLAPGCSGEARDPEKWLFLDTETTGLSGGTGTYAFLVGIAWWEDGRFVVEQYFMKDHSEEPSMLLGLLSRLRQRPVLVTYNGRSFDWPLLETRYRMTRAGEAGPLSAHLDLLYPARRLWKLSLKSVALRQVETHVLGFDRGKDIPSEMIPQLYFNFLRGGSPDGLAAVFQHNRMDLCGLAFLALRICDILSDPAAFGSSASELFGVSRLLQQRGDVERAECFYRMAVEKGLPELAERIALKEMALAAKRRRNFELSNRRWEKLLGGTAEGIEAYEQLAIYYEHYARDLQQAALLTREALLRLQEAYRAGLFPQRRYMRLYADFRHRLARLAAKEGMRGQDGTPIKNATDSTD